ncbi:hypothetical protein PC118_g24575, partial [Phytophthora cactorum]
NAEKQKAFALF